jgi:hypothetical protein
MEAAAQCDESVLVEESGGGGPQIGDADDDVVDLEPLVRHAGCLAIRSS